MGWVEGGCGGVVGVTGLGRYRVGLLSVDSGQVRFWRFSLLLPSLTTI
jgi:hypothetical protein